jgi:hypothetical protein
LSIGAHTPPSTIDERPHIRQTPLPEAGAVVVTSRQTACSYQTRVEAGGHLDAWMVPASSLAEALDTHDYVVRLVVDSVGASPSRRQM